METPTGAQNQPESGARVGSSAGFCVGDRVTWTHSSSNGSSWRFHTREGKVLEVEGDAVLLQMRNGRKCWQHVSSLTKAGETTDLTKAFMAIADGIAKPTPNKDYTTPVR